MNELSQVNREMKPKRHCNPRTRPGRRKIFFYPAYTLLICIQQLSVQFVCVYDRRPLLLIFGFRVLRHCEPFLPARQPLTSERQPSTLDENSNIGWSDVRVSVKPEKSLMRGYYGCLSRERRAALRWGTSDWRVAAHHARCALISSSNESKFSSSSGRSSLAAGMTVTF